MPAYTHGGEVGANEAIHSSILVLIMEVMFAQDVSKQSSARSGGGRENKPDCQRTVKSKTKLQTKNT